MEWLINRRRMMFNKAAPPAYLVFNDPVFWSMCCNDWGDYNEIVVTDNGNNTVNIVTTFKSMLNTTVKTSTVISTQTNVDNSGGTYTAGTTKEAVGITAKQCAAVTNIGALCQNNNSVSDARELGYFTGITSIPSNAFSGCSVEYITIPSTVTSVGRNFCASTTNLTSIVFPESVTSINSGVFYTPNALQHCTILGDVTTIGADCFRSSNLIDFTIYSVTPPTLGARTFTSIPSTAKFYVPAESVDTYKAASGWSSHSSKIEAIPQT